MSKEQERVIDALRHQHNVVIDSVAGSGKTTCNLHIAKHFSDKNILLLTYNSKLKLETREKVAQLDIPNLETHSYHSFCVKYYDRECYTDSEIRILLQRGATSMNPFCYDFIILDEAQDISFLYFELICKIFRDNGCGCARTNPVQICILGDEKQSIFDFNGADQRFITFSSKIYTFNDLPWTECKLNRSFRITDRMADFVNHCLLRETRMISLKSSQYKPRYIICDSYNQVRFLFDEVKEYLEMGYLPDDIFILAPSLRQSASPVCMLENIIKRELDVPIYVPTGDDIKLDEEILKHKLVFSSFHQSKGLERKVVLVFGFDNSYFKFYKKNTKMAVCPNEIYVAATRAKEHLVLIHERKYDYFPFLDREKLEDYCHVVRYSEINLNMDNARKLKQKTIAVCDILRHLPQGVVDECYNYLDVVSLQKAHLKVNIPVKVSQGDLKEQVSEITGEAIPSYLEYILKGSISFTEQLRENCPIGEMVEFDAKSGPGDLLCLANQWNAYKSGFIFKLKQIQDYNWLEKPVLEECVERMIRNFGFTKDVKMEQPYMFHHHKLPKHIHGILGYVDCIFDDAIFEFKCVGSLSKEHHLQLALYMYLYEMQHYPPGTQENDNRFSSRNLIIGKGKELEFPEGRGGCQGQQRSPGVPPNEMNVVANNEDAKKRKYYLYNILTDELREIQCEREKLCQMVDFMIEAKYAERKQINDAAFLTHVKNLR